MAAYVDASLQSYLRSDILVQTEGGLALDGYVRVANDILFNPEGTIERVEQAYEEGLQAGDDDGTQASLNGERGLAQIERISEDMQSKVEQFEDREEAPWERFQGTLD